MISAKTVLFERPGPKNTAQLIAHAVERIRDLGIRHLVIASNTGRTSLAFSEAIKGTDITIVSVTEHAGFQGNDSVYLTEERAGELQEKGIKMLMCSHALSGVERSITNTFGGTSRVEIIAHTLRLFGGEGLKVAVEVAIMAADAGLIPTDCEVAAVGGTGKGADTAIILKPAHMNNFFDLEIREIIAKPRQRKTGYSSSTIAYS